LNSNIEAYYIATKDPKTQKLKNSKNLQY